MSNARERQTAEDVLTVLRLARGCDAEDCEECPTSRMCDVGRKAIAAALRTARAEERERCARAIEARFDCKEHRYEQAAAEGLPCASRIARHAAVIRALGEEGG